MVNTPQARESGYGTADVWTAQAEHARYRTALGIINDTTSVAAGCPCCLLVARVAAAALAPPAPRVNYWRYCEA